MYVHDQLSFILGCFTPGNRLNCPLDMRVYRDPAAEYVV
jgi:hypothetical protein